MSRGMVAANWKMHGSRQFIADYVRGLEISAAAAEDFAPRLVLIPPIGYLGFLASLLSEAGLKAVELGAQNLHSAPEGAFTGEMSAEMLADLGAGWVLVGHSERRQLAGETNEVVGEKTAAVLRAGMKPVICVGETEAERETDKAAEVVTGQLEAVVERCGIQALAGAAVAYEPVWAIGTGKTATPGLAQDMHGLIRATLANWSADVAAEVPLLYGGSVKASNARELFAEQDIDGGLVGGASLQANEIVQIARCLGSS